MEFVHVSCVLRVCVLDSPPNLFVYGIPGLEGKRGMAWLEGIGPEAVADVKFCEKNKALGKRLAVSRDTAVLFGGPD